jgi:hypothetical protein
LNVHLTISVSADAPLTSSLFSSLDQKVEKEGSLIRCQTALKGASMTADSLTEVEVGMGAIVAVVWLVIGLGGCGTGVRVFYVDVVDMVVCV